MEHWLASSSLDTKDVVTAVEDFLLAGVHTSAYAASFLLYNMARNPGVQDRLEGSSSTSLNGKENIFFKGWRGSVRMFSTCPGAG